MPAGLPGATLAENQANPSQGGAVIFDPLSGPKAAPLDARKITGWTNGYPTYANDATNISTGALATGIGFGSPPIFGDTAVGGFSEGNFTDDYVPGQDLPVGTSAANSSIMYIGGGRSNADGTPDPYDVAMVGICMAGNGASRDGGTTPFTGFPVKTVTAAGTVANGAVVETGFTNRSGKSITVGQSVFGSNGTPLTDAA